MKAMYKITFGLTALLMVGFIGDGVQAAQQKGVSATISEESLGLRKTNLYNEDGTVADKTQYSTAQATTSTKFKRAFQDAPPMIPHDTVGMLPIKINDNRCVSCHMPDVAGSMGATPIPVSHFTNFRPQHKVTGGEFKKVVDNYKNEVVIKEENKLQGSRFNCSLCHAPQSQGKLVVENTFEPVFTSKDGAEKSSWNGKKLTEALNTLGDESFVTQDDIANKNSPAGSLEGAAH